MTDVYAAHSQFVLLAEDPRRRWFDAKTVFLIGLISLPIIIFCGIYAIMIQTSEHLVYPKSETYVPRLLDQRLEIYGSQAKVDFEPEFEMAGFKIYYSKQIAEDFKLVCYYTFPGKGADYLQPEQIEPNICTHINVAFASVLNNSVHLPEFEIKILKQIVKLKDLNQNLKILISVGGAGGDSGFGQMVYHHSTRKIFIKSVLDYVKLYKIDGVDLDWEFPNESPGSDKQQKLHFTQLLLEFRKVINRQDKHKFLLTVAVAAPTVLIDKYYYVAYMNQSVDFINLMTYDFHFYTKFTPFTGLNAPLYQTSKDSSGYLSTLNINYSANYWSLLGMDRRKIVVGLPTYAHTFKLTNVQNNGLYAPAKSYGKLGTNGFADYGQVCKFLTLNRVSPVFDLEAKSPYASKLSEWISFENEQSIVYKTEFIRDQMFGGAMVFSLNSDDYAGSCKLDKKVKSQRFPLIKRIHEVLDRNYSIF